MVFSSIPAYLDPSNWQQQSSNQNIVSSSTINSQLLAPAQQPPPPPPPSQPHGGGGSGSIRPGSLADRARMANIPMPEGPLKCPRCDSSNTKFCYFNNYSLTQPRHFCKTCRRYWTRGGALRSVPVGGGCRRNKRSKGSSSKSSASSSDIQTNSGNSSTSAMSSMSSTAELLGLTHPQVTQLRFMAPLHSLADFNSPQIGLNYGGIPAHLGATNDLSFQLGSTTLGNTNSASSLLQVGNMDQWRLQPPQQLPFLGGLDNSSGLYALDGGNEQGGYGGHVRAKSPTSGVITQLASVKMEENQELNLSRQFLGVTGNDQYWSGTGSANWTDLSGFSSSSTSHPQ